MTSNVFWMPFFPHFRVSDETVQRTTISFAGNLACIDRDSILGLGSGEYSRLYMSREALHNVLKGEKATEFSGSRRQGEMLRVAVHEYDQGKRLIYRGQIGPEVVLSRFNDRRELHLQRKRANDQEAERLIREAQTHIINTGEIWHQGKFISVRGTRNTRVCLPDQEPDYQFEDWGPCDFFFEEPLPKNGQCLTHAVLGRIRVVSGYIEGYMDDLVSMFLEYTCDRRLCSFPKEERQYSGVWVYKPCQYDTKIKLRFERRSGLESQEMEISLRTFFDWLDRSSIEEGVYLREPDVMLTPQASHELYRFLWGVNPPCSA